ncbi:MAG: hypothetical protein Fur0041_10060 [Bacteroidia bacterium]
MKKSYFNVIAFLVAALIPVLASAQFGLPAGFNVKEFHKNEDLALWFLQYDSTAIRVSAFDRNLAGKDIVCIPEKSGWKVAAGKITDEGLTEARYYQVDSKNIVSNLKKKPDTTQFTSIAKALYHAQLNISKLNIKNVSWKKFPKVNEDLSITVYAFCDGDPSGMIWYGPEYAWYFSSNGETQIANKSISKAPMMAGKSANGLNLSCPAEKMPTLGIIWMAHRFRNTYKEVTVDYKTGISTFVYNPSDHVYAWEHNAK